MKKLKNLLNTLFLMSIYFSGQAQISKTTIVEHFTNTSCSVCANNNAGYYSTINGYANVLHISFHPSSPYASDVFSQQNTVENDARTNFYAVYGATPRLVVNGTVIANNQLSATLNAQSSVTTNYAFDISQTFVAPDSFVVRTVIRKVAADTISNALLFVGVSEDTIVQTTNNGEMVHYNVFRKTLTNITGNSVTLPSSVGDSIVQTFGYRAGGSWQLEQLHSIGILQENNKAVINSAKSVNTENMPLFVTEIKELVSKDIFFPNPFTGTLQWNGEIQNIFIYNQMGALVFQSNHPDNRGQQHISIPALPGGIYFAKVAIDGQIYIQKLLRSEK